MRRRTFLHTRIFTEVLVRFPTGVLSYADTSVRQHVCTSMHQYICMSVHQRRTFLHTRIFTEVLVRFPTGVLSYADTSVRQHVCTSMHQYICMSVHQRSGVSVRPCGLAVSNVCFRPCPFICLVASSFLSAKEYTNPPVCIVSPLRGSIWLRSGSLSFICLVASSFLSAKEYTNPPVCIVSPLRGSIWLRSGSLWRSSAPSRCVFTPYLCIQAAGQCSRCAYRTRFRLSFGQLEGIGRPIPAGLVTGRSIPNPSRTDSY